MCNYVRLYFDPRVQIKSIEEFERMISNSQYKFIEFVRMEGIGYGFH